ncbi:DUF2894 domain-containing protein [Burkholderia sp. 3C]
MRHASDDLPQDAARARLDAWRADGCDRIDPLRFGLIDALHRRANAHSGAARRVIDTRLHALLEDYAARIEQARGAASNQAPAAPLPSPFAALSLDKVRTARSAPPAAVLDYFRELWSKLSADRQVQVSLDSVPKNAGPLNSSSLVHRALLQMRDISPDYLRHFLGYAETLSWLDDLQRGDPATTAAKEAPRAAAAKKPKRGTRTAR